MESEGDDNTNDMDDRGNMSDDNLGSCGSVDDIKTPPDDDTESLNQSLSSPGGFSGLSSLQSPSTSLASPLTPNTLMHIPHMGEKLTHMGESSSNRSGGTNNAISPVATNNNNINSSSNNNNNSNSNNNNNITTNGLSNANSTMLGTGMSLTPEIGSASAASNCLSGSIVSSAHTTQPNTQKLLFGSVEPAPINGSQQNNKIIVDNNDCISQKKSIDVPSGKKVQSSDEESHKLSSPLYGSKLKQSMGSGATTLADSVAKIAEKNALLHNQGISQHQHHLQQQHHQYQQKLLYQQQQQQLKQPLPPHPFHFLNQPDLFYEKIIRNPVGANPRDVNNPLSINQLTKRDYGNTPVALSPSALHHIMGNSPLNSQASAAAAAAHVSSQLFPGPSAADFRSFSLQQELLNHHQQQNSLTSHLQSRAFAASMMSAQHPYPHAQLPFSVAQDVSAVASIQPPSSTSSVPGTNSRRCVSEDSSGGAISVT